MIAAFRHDRRTRHVRRLLIAWMVVSGPEATAQTRKPARDTDRAERVNTLFAEFARMTGPGAAVAVACGDSIVFARGYGFADVEHGVAITPATSFRLASVTKQFTAAAILTLVEQRRLSLDDRLGDVLPGTPGYARDVRVRHLLAHTSGVPDYEPLAGPEDGEPQLHDRDVLALLHGARALHFVPGTSWRYSNSGYALLALIIEHASGERFADYLRRHVFDPAGMGHAVAHQDGVDTVPNRAYGYSSRQGQWVRTDQNRTSAVLGDGGIYASVEELVRWSAALDRNTVVTPQSFALATTPVALASGAHTGYGFGWFLDAMNGHRRQRHEGDSIGFRTAIQRYPDDGLTVIVLVNRGAAPIDALSDGVARIYLAP